MRKHLLPFVVLPLAFFGSLLLFVLGNRTTPVLRSGSPLPSDIETRGYALSFSVDEDVHRLQLDCTDDTASLTLVLAAMRPFSVSLDGSLLYEYTDTMSYSRVHEIQIGSLSAGVHTLSITSSTSQHWLKALLTTPTRAADSLRSARTVSTLSIGMHVAMILNCCFLFYQKRSERYLLVQVSIAFISLLSALLTSDLGPMPFPDGTYVEIQHIINGVTTPLWIFFCLLIANYSVPPKKARIFYPLCAASMFVCTLLYRFSQPLLLECVVLPLFVLGAILLARACAKGQIGLFLLIAFAVRFALRYYNQATNWGLLPNSELLVYLYTPHLGNLLLLLACGLEVNRRFAKKFTEAELLVQKLEESNALLDAKVEERTAQLKEQQRQKHNMILNTYHDLRSPLFSARGCADMLAPQTNEDRECLDILKQKLDFLSQLTEDLFLIAKLEDGKITFTQRRIDLCELFRALDESAQVQAQLKQISFCAQCEVGIIVLGDGFRLKQALENLISNAFRFTPQGGYVRLSARREDESVLIQLEDSGKGIAPQDLPHVFERYYQGSRNRSDASAGLGLSIAQEIIRRHNGQIWVQSTIGVGTSFFIRLPLLPSSAPSPDLKPL